MASWLTKPYALDQDEGKTIQLRDVVATAKVFKSTPTLEKECDGNKSSGD